MDAADDLFTRALEDVAAGRGPRSEHLAGLSHLAPEQVARLRLVWSALTETQRRELLESLSRLEAATPRLEFNAVYGLALDDPAAAVRRAAIVAIIEDPGVQLLEPLIVRLLDDPDAGVRAAAARALEPFARRAELGELSDEDAVRLRDALFQVLHRDGEPSAVRGAALAALGYFSDERVRGELEAGWRNAELRLQALRGFGHNADERWLRYVVEAMESPESALREAAAEAAGEICAEEAVPRLADLVDDPSLSVRLAAIAALGEIGGEEAREALLYALEDKRQVIRDAAEEALTKLEGFEEPLSF